MLLGAGVVSAPIGEKGLVWPNPAVGILYLNGISQTVLLDVTGRKVAELQPGANDLQHVPAGVYFARSKTGVRQKVVIRR
ncbi:hypothetical protein CH330_03665 [candidate division WOR-3 bacterium JGI_Cruoil_03_51_56]|uniref:Uncharacterized protein n=1 Tax=candidate division WOR-3 bacterium JGI_Cruoil_03_51_56 TaxID=1973747 RepID=A0A235BX62_UNCW3|nr:MAG: hypothetical protein CH330_03665 [candidate division WOR-3 bacterium JGI_Cruoil_03_51_56]